MWWPKLTGCATCRWVKPGRMVSTFFSARSSSAFCRSASSAGDQVDLAAQPQAHVGGDLVVAAAAGVQALAGVARQLRQARLDVQVHVFQVELPLELARIRSPARSAPCPSGSPRRSAARDDALRRQHLRVRQRAFDVGLPQALVEEHAGGVALDQVAHGLGKQGRPGLGFLVELVHREAGGAAGYWFAPGVVAARITNNRAKGTRCLMKDSQILSTFQDAAAPRRRRARRGRWCSTPAMSA